MVHYILMNASTGKFLTREDGFKPTLDPFTTAMFGSPRMAQEHAEKSPICRGKVVEIKMVELTLR